MAASRQENAVLVATINEPQEGVLRPKRESKWPKVSQFDRYIFQKIANSIV